MGSLSQVRVPDTYKTMGIELECYYDVSVAPRLYHFYQFWFFDSDGSIDPAYNCIGVEAISQPLPRDALINQIKRLHKKFGRWQFNNSCGIHVHVNRHMLPARRYKEILSWMKTLVDTPEKQRQLFGREYNSYCDPNTWLSDKYCAINTQHDETYEFRVFSSGDVDWAIECVNRTYLMATYKGEYTYENICALFGIAPIV